MRILITGGLGYVGSALYAYLSPKHTVDTVDLEQRGNKTNPRNLSYDYRMLSRLETERFDAVIHLAGHASVAACDGDPHGAIKNNLTGVLDILPRLAGRPFLYASSASVHALKHNTLYDGTKRALEALVPSLYPNAYGLRFGTVCGPAPNIRTDLILQAMVRSAMTRGCITVTNAHAGRAVLGTQDLCRQVEQLLSGAYLPGAFNLCSYNAKIGDIAMDAAEQLGVELVEAEGPPTYDFEMEPDLPGAQETTGSIVKGLVDSYKRGEWQ